MRHVWELSLALALVSITAGSATAGVTVQPIVGPHNYDFTITVDDEGSGWSMAGFQITEASEADGYGDGDPTTQFTAGYIALPYEFGWDLGDWYSTMPPPNPNGWGVALLGQGPGVADGEVMTLGFDYSDTSRTLFHYMACAPFPDQRPRTGQVDFTGYGGGEGDDSPEVATWALLLATGAFGGWIKRRRKED